MLKPSDFNNAVPKFQNGTYANNPLDPTDVAEPTMEDYVRGVEPLDTLPAQWWNWLCNQFTSRFNKINTYVKNVFDELTQLLSLVGVTPDGTEGTITTGQLKNAFEQRYPNFLSKFIHTIAQIWSYTGSSTSGSVTTTQASRLAVFEKVTASDSSTSPATTTDTYNTKYVDILPVRLGGTGCCTKQGALANLTSDLTCPETLPTTADVIINNNGVMQKTPVSSIVSYAGTVSIQNSTANSYVPVALCTGFTSVGKSNCCPLTYNPVTGELTTSSLNIPPKSSIDVSMITCKIGCFPDYNQWLLLQDITTWYNGPANNTTLTGRFIITRCAGRIESTVIDAVMAHSSGRNGCPLTCNNCYERFFYSILPGMDNADQIKPVIICENATGKVYTALRKTYGRDGFVTFEGENRGDIVGTIVPGGGQDVTIPSGWTHLYEAPIGGVVGCATCATNASTACSFREAQIIMCNSCWLKLGSLICGYTGGILKFSLSRSYNFQQPEQHDITILTGKLAPDSTRVIEDANGCQLFSCIRFGYQSCYACPVDIYVKYNCACTNPVRISYCNTSPVNGSFIPSFTQVSDACASACTCTCNIPLHENGHYINGCRFDTTCVNTACVNASCCVCTSCVCASCCISTSCVSAPDPGSTASKTCNLTLQAFCTNASCVKTTQAMTFCGSTGGLHTDTDCFAFYAPNGAICARCIITAGACFKNSQIHINDALTGSIVALTAHGGYYNSKECDVAKSFLNYLSSGVTKAIGYIKDTSNINLPIDRICRGGGGTVCIGYTPGSTMTLCWAILCCTNTNTLASHSVIREIKALFVP